MTRRFIAAILLFLSLTAPAFAAMECDTLTETALQEAIASEPTKLVRELDGSDLATFISNMTTRGYLMGGIPGVDHIYIVDAGKKPGFTVDQVWLFFIQDGCLIFKVGAIKSVVVEMLP